MAEILHAFAGPLRKVDVDTAPSTPGVDVSSETSRRRHQVAWLLAIASGSVATWAVWAFITGNLPFQVAEQIIKMNPANDN